MNARLKPGIGAALLAAGLCLGSVVFAAEPLKSVTIEAGALTKTPISTSATGVPLEQVTLTRHVSYEDLDLSTVAGAAELRRRVNATANAACKQLEELYPAQIRNHRECTKAAIAGASRQVEEAIAAASKQADEE
jgi:UrcA family protein